MGRDRAQKSGVRAAAQPRRDAARGGGRDGQTAVRSPTGRGVTPAVASLLRLQRSVGNSAVRALLAEPAPQSLGARALQRRAKPTGVLVHRRSRLSAAQLVTLVKANAGAPDWVKRGLGSSGGSLVKKGPLAGPTNVIVDVSESLRDAVTSGDWEITTGTTTLTVSLTKPLRHGSALRKSWSRGKENPWYDFLDWKQVVTPDLEPNEHLVRMLKTGPSTTMASPVAIHTEDPEILYGDTELVDTTSQIAQAPAGHARGLIVLVTEIDVTAPDGTTKTFQPTDDQLVESLLHELSAHAGQETEHKPSEHGRGDVNAIADEIGGWFGTSPTTGAIYDFIQAGADVELRRALAQTIHEFPF